MNSFSNGFIEAGPQQKCSKDGFNFLPKHAADVRGNILTQPLVTDTCILLDLVLADAVKAKSGSAVDVWPTQLCVNMGILHPLAGPLSLTVKIILGTAVLLTSGGSRLPD